ncbi:MAG: hypothetical protein QOE42_728, partial [Chloroflexota bacterium]|nr:hypothetical protein [Chloroflexota bacterium]
GRQSSVAIRAMAPEVIETGPGDPSAARPLR